MSRLLLAGCLVAACTSRKATFPCTSSCECIDGLEQGTCEPAGFCAFLDPSCVSGRRYGQGASADLDGACAGSGTAYYVAVDGDDANVGTSPDQPVRHLSKAATFANHAGDTVIVEDGTYDNEGQVGPMTSVVAIMYDGEPGSPITFMARHRGHAVLDAGNHAGASCAGAGWYLGLGDRSSVVVQGFVIENTCTLAMQVNGANVGDVVIRWNEITHIGDWDWGATGDAPKALYIGPDEHGVQIDGNVFHDIGPVASTVNQQIAIEIAGSGATIVNNAFYDQANGWDVALVSANDVTIAHNTFAFPSDQPGHVALSGTLSGVAIFDNVFYAPGGGVAITELQSPAITDCTITDNATNAGVIYQGSACTETADRMIDPGLVSTATPTAPDLHLAAGSPAIDAAVAVPGLVVTADLDGTCRPQGAASDLGAYERSP